MKKVLVLVLIAALCIGMLAGCSGTPAKEENGETAANGEGTVDGKGDSEYLWKVGLIQNEGDSNYEAVKIFCDELEKQSEGRIKTEIYPGNQLGEAKDCLEGLQFGMVDVYYESVGTLATWAPKANIDAVPYLYSGFDHFKKVWDSELGDEIRDEIGQTSGFKLLGSFYRGVRITTTTEKIESLADFAGFKIRVPNIPIYIDTWKWLGAAPTPLPGGEIFTAMQQGTVNGQENTVVDSYNVGFYDCSDYLIETNHVYSQNVLIMDRNYFSGLPEDIQKIVEDSAKIASDYKGQVTVAEEEEYRQKFIDKGVEDIKIDLNEFIDMFEDFGNEKYPELADWMSKIREMDPNK